MKALACLMVSLFSVLVVAQTHESDGAWPPISLSADGKSFQTMSGTYKKFSDLKVADLPGSADNPLSMEATGKCFTLAQLETANERQNGAIAELVPDDVIEAVPGAAGWCLVRDLQLVPDNVRRHSFAQIAAMVTASAELDQRRYNRLVEKYNALLETAKQLNRQLTQTYTQLGRQQGVNDALAIYRLMPKYKPVQLPPPLVFSNPSFRCTSRQIGTSTYTDCN